MENNEAPRLKWAVIVVVVAVILLGVYLVYKYKGSAKLDSPATLGDQVAEQIQNPGAAVPDVNPYDTKTNPYDAKVNPFRDVYKNPFK